MCCHLFNKNLPRKGIIWAILSTSFTFFLFWLPITYCFLKYLRITSCHIPSHNHLQLDLCDWNKVQYKSLKLNWRSLLDGGWCIFKNQEKEVQLPWLRSWRIASSKVFEMFFLFFFLNQVQYLQLLFSVHNTISSQMQWWKKKKKFESEFLEILFNWPFPFVLADSSQSCGPFHQNSQDYRGAWRPPSC